MTTGSDFGNEVAGGPARHVPVLVDAVMAVLAPRPDAVIIDGTFGAGGYTRALIAAGARVVAIDRDPDAIRVGSTLLAGAQGRLSLVQGRFSELDAHARAAGHVRVDGVVLDVGVSSMQLDEAERGFSFRADGPLDMRMERQGPSAADVVNTLGRRDLTRLIGLLGEERRAADIARGIEAARRAGRITRTLQLAEIVERAVGQRRGDRIHPATRTFQALRIFVNRELEELARALCAAEGILRAGGRLAVVAFHSLEDRIVKRFLAERSATRPGISRHRPEREIAPPAFRVPGRQPIEPDEAEIARNPRARSARLRWGERTEAPARPFDAELFALPALPALDGGG